MKLFNDLKKVTGKPGDLFGSAFTNTAHQSCPNISLKLHGA
jgi:hypothetical protein